VYVIELPEASVAAPIDPVLIRAWIKRVPSLRVDGKAPSTTELARRLSSFWIAGETVLYVGLAGTSIRKRVGQYYRTALGNPGPHAGGHWIKTLSALDEMRVWWARSPEPHHTEGRLLVSFADRHPGALPFANRQGPAGSRKAHGITGSTLPRRATVAGASPGRARSSRAGRDDRLAKINAALQKRASADRSREISAPEGGRELARLGLLRDSTSRPGLPLRELLRAGEIKGAYQDSSRRWHIRAAGIESGTAPAAQGGCGCLLAVALALVSVASASYLGLPTN
jgi:hypothetical protein